MPMNTSTANAGPTRSMPVPSLAAAFDEYLGRLGSWGRTSRTIDKYRREGTKMAAFFEDCGARSASDVDRQLVDAWVGALSARLDPATVRCLISMAQGFFGDLHARGEIPTDLLHKYPKPRLAQGPQTVLDPDDVRSIIAGLPAHDFYGGRMRLLLSVWMYAGLRLSETLALDWSDVDLPASTLKVWLGKGGRSRAVPINAQLAGEFTTYRSRWAASRSQPGGPVFTSRRHNRFKSKDVYAALDRFDLRRKYRIGPRSLRRSFGTWLGQRIPLSETQKLMGHASPATTAAYYVMVASPRLHQAVATFCPAPTPAMNVTLPAPRPQPIAHGPRSRPRQRRRFVRRSRQLPTALPAA